MRFTPIAALLLASFMIQSQAAEQRRYTILVDNGVKAGEQIVDIADDGELKVRFIFKDNGRGPELNESIKLNPDGTIASYAWTFGDGGSATEQQIYAGTVTETHGQAEAFVATLAERMTRGAAFFLDYGFPEGEYYHPQRTGGTLMCHRAHRADGDPLADVGDKDITAHVNFTGIALAAQNAGQQVLGYTSQARFLINCGLVDLASAASVAERAQAMKLVHEHEMGELFKVLALAPATSAEGWSPVGFSAGDRTHRL